MISIYKPVKTTQKEVFMPVIDMHCDSIYLLKDGTQNLRENSLQIDLYKMKKSDYMLQNFALFVDMKESEHPLETGLSMADLFFKEMESNKDLIRQVTTYDEIMENQKQGLMSALLTLEEGEICQGDPALLRIFHRLGVRMITLTWNYENSIGFPNIYGTHPQGIPCDKGLTANGLDFIKEMEHLGIIIDVSHLSDGGFYDVLHNTTRPFVASHSNARRICSHSRNLTDDMIRKMGERGCVTGLNYFGFFVNESSDRSSNEGCTIDGLVRHVKHITSIGGMECLGLGSDFDGFSGYCELSDCSKLYLLEDGLKKAGFHSSDIDKIFYQNVLNVYREILK